jgi:hypothetical protein
MNPEQIVKKVDDLKGQRGVWESHWQECLDYVMPNKNDVTKMGAEGEKKGVNLFDSTAIQANELLAGALHGLLTNPSAIWFDLSTGEENLDDDDTIKKWLQKTTRTIHMTLNNSNFQTEIHECYLDLTSVGTAPLFMEEDDETDVRFSSHLVAGVLVEENSKGLIDRVYRIFRWTAKQIVQEFGKDALKISEVKKAYEKELADKFEVIQAIYYRDQDGLSEEKKKGPKGYPVASKHVFKKSKTELRESGFREWPCAVPRWSKTSNEVYGRSPTMKVLADVKMLNAMQESVIQGAQLTAAPPVQAPDDGFILPLKTKPYGVNYYRAGSSDRIEEIFKNVRVDFGHQTVEDVRKRIREGYYVDIFQLANGPQKTAYEVAQITEEKMRLLGPLLGRMQPELLQVMITRVFGILFRKGKIDKIPDQLMGRRIVVRYSSLIARAQRISEGQNIMRMMQAVQPFVQLDPTIMDNVDGDEVLKFVADVYGTPAKVMRDKSDVKKIRAGRAQAQQKLMQQQDEAHKAEQIAKVAPAAVKAKEAGIA